MGSKPDAFIACVDGLPVQTSICGNPEWSERGWEVKPLFAINDETREALAAAIDALKRDNSMGGVSKHIAALSRLAGKE